MLSLLSRTSRLALLASTVAACAHSPAPTAAQVAPACANSPGYNPNATPCDYVAGELARIAPSIATCARHAGIVEVTYEFDQAAATPRRVRASLGCGGCRTPYYVDARAFLDCVERIASTLHLTYPNQTAFSSTYWYNVGEPEDERLKLGWQPGEDASH